jgi:large subunit ribosomal protein L35
MSVPQRFRARYGLASQQLRNAVDFLIGAPFIATLRRTARLVWAAVAVLDRSRKGDKMPKLKTKSGVKKRFKLTATGKIKCGVAGKRHRLISHNSKYIRQNRGTDVLAAPDTVRVKLWAPYGLN